MDALKAAPEATTLLMENERVRVFTVKFKPGMKTIVHSHPDHVIYVLKDGKVKITIPGGASNDVSLKAGQVIWMPAGQHAVENLGKTEAENLIIELKK
jgi:quercetin dioxygenase-like cupin family protein